MQLKLHKLKDRQRDILNAWNDKSINFITVCCGRQVGKTQTAVQIAIKTLVEPLYEQSMVKIGFFLPTYKQARMVFKRVKTLLGNNQGFTFNKTELRVTYKGLFKDKPINSFIEFWTSENDNCRGNTYDYLFVDEACFVKSDIWFEAILATGSVALSAKKGKVLLTSTPKEKNWFYDYFMDKKEGYKSIKFTSYESGLQSEEFLDDLKRKTPKPIFDNEYMAEFVDGVQSLFDTAQLKYSNNITDKKGVVAGVDWGMDNDYTVLSILNANKEVCHIRRWRKLPWNQLVEEIAADLRAFGLPLTYAEKNGIGNMPTGELTRLYGSVRPVNTTAQLKTDMILKLSKDLLDDKKPLILPDIDYVRKEFANYGISYVNGNAKFGNISNNVNDDCVMSIAIANHNFKGGSITFAR